MRQRAALILGVVLLLVAGAAVSGWRWWHGRPPYGPEVLAATATLGQVDQATMDAAFAPRSAEQAGVGDQIFLGQVAWRRPPNPQRNGTFWIVVLDKRTHLMPGFVNATSARPDDVSSGSHGALDVAEERYPWLEGAGAREVNGGFSSAGSAVAVSSVDATPVTFAVVLHPELPGTPPHLAVATAPAAASDLLVALVNVGPDGQVYWAQRLLN